MRGTKRQNGQHKIVKAFQPSLKREEALDGWLGNTVLTGLKESETVPRLIQCCDVSHS